MSQHPNAPRQTQRQSDKPRGELTENEQISSDERAKDRMKKLFELIRQRRPEIEAVLPPDVPYAKFEAVVNMAIRREPRLLDTYGPSFIKASIQAAYDGLLPDGNQAVILYSNNKVPGTGRDGKKAMYRVEARYQSMVYGIRLKLVQSGAVKFVDAKIVYSKEHFVHEEGLNPKLEHKPILDPEARGEPVAVYAKAVLPDGERVFDVLSKIDVMAAREVAKTKDVWDGPFGGEMWKKTAIRRLSKAIPTVTPMRDAEAIDLFPQFGGQQPALPAPPRPTRGDFKPAALEHQVEVPLDLGAFEGGYETEESLAATRAGEEHKPKPAAKKKAAKKPAGTDEAAEEISEAEHAAGDGEAEPYEPRIAVPLVLPADEEAWHRYADDLKAAIPNLGNVDAINAERQAHQPMIDQAPGKIGDELADAFADALTDLV